MILSGQNRQKHSLKECVFVNSDSYRLLFGDFTHWESTFCIVLVYLYYVIQYLSPNVRRAKSAISTCHILDTAHRHINLFQWRVKGFQRITPNLLWTRYSR